MSKWHILIDTLDLLIIVIRTAADVSEQAGAKKVGVAEQWNEFKQVGEAGREFYNLLNHPSIQQHQKILSKLNNIRNVE